MGSPSFALKGAHPVLRHCLHSLIQLLLTHKLQYTLNKGQNLVGLIPLPQIFDGSALPYFQKSDGEISLPSPPPQIVLWPRHWGHLFNTRSSKARK